MYTNGMYNFGIIPMVILYTYDRFLDDFLMIFFDDFFDDFLANIWQIV